MIGKNRMMIYGPNTEGTYVVEFRTAAGEAFAIQRASWGDRVLNHLLNKYELISMN